jgi:hypothetical protein
VSLAFPALIILLCLLPGIVFIRSYLSGKFSRRVADLSPLTELALYVAASIPLLWFALQLLLERPEAFRLSVRALVTTLDAPRVDEVIRGLTKNGMKVFWGYLVLLAGSAFLGTALRRLVWMTRLDLHFPALRMKHRIYYLLQGRREGVPRYSSPIADILTEMPGQGTCLYRGTVLGFDFDESGKLSEIILVGTKRGKQRGEAFEWVPIPGTYFVILERHVHSINMDYFFMDLPAEPAERNRVKRRRFWRSLIYEDQ